jgi:hypothetical protein
VNKRTISMISFAIFTLLIGTLLAACGTGNSGRTGSSTTDGQTLMLERCSVCHSTDRVISAHKTAAGWKISVDRMIAHGAQLTPAEEQTLVDYLAVNFK